MPAVANHLLLEHGGHPLQQADHCGQSIQAEYSIVYRVLSISRTCQLRLLTAVIIGTHKLDPRAAKLKP